MAASGDVILVTGSAGFLGQKIVELLLKKGENIREIRGLDLAKKPRDFEEAKGVTCRYYQGDICNYQLVKDALQGVRVVIHAASLVDISQTTSKQLTAVNVQGTENIIRGCVECNVPHLVYTSTQDVVLGWNVKHDIDESVPYPGDSASHFVFGEYAFTKMLAERKVLAANGIKLPNGTSLITCALRVNLLYGEREPWTLPSIIKVAKSNFGYLTRMGDGTAQFQFCYVGNAAWAHVIATRLIASKPDVVGGKIYYITDKTPLQDFFSFVEPFLLAAGCQLTPFYIPYSIMWFIAMLLEVISWVLKPFVVIQLPITQGNVFAVCKLGATFSSVRAKRELGYFPLYSFEESKTQTIRYIIEKLAD